MFYRWPLDPTDKIKPRLGTLGEFRGLADNDITRIHSGTDLAVPGDYFVYSPDVGMVRRYGPASSGNPSAGTGPFRIGHWAFNHVINVYVEPQTTQFGVDLPANLPIYVQKAASKYYVPRSGLTTAPTTDAHFRSLTLPAGAPVVAYHKKGANDYVNATIWPQDLAVGKKIEPTDLHCFYYESSDGPVADGDNIRNALEVLENYENAVEPVADGLWMYTQVGNTSMLDMRASNTAVIHTAAMAGVKFKLSAYTQFNAKCGVYQVEYEILNNLGNTTGRLNMWKFHRLPRDDKSFDIVDEHLSLFATPNDKFTVYIITNSRNGDINTDHHWEVEDSTKWPDGCYAVKVWLKSIKKARGTGIEPRVNEVLYAAEYKVETQQPGKRKIAVTDRFKKRDLTWKPAFPGCPKEKSRRRSADDPKR